MNSFRKKSLENSEQPQLAVERFIHHQKGVLKASINKLILSYILDRFDTGKKFVERMIWFKFKAMLKCHRKSAAILLLSSAFFVPAIACTPADRDYVRQHIAGSELPAVQRLSVDHRPVIAAKESDALALKTGI